MGYTFDHEEWVRIKKDRVLVGWLVRPIVPAARRRSDWMLYPPDRSRPLMTADARLIWLKGTNDQVYDEAVRILTGEGESVEKVEKVENRRIGQNIPITGRI